MRNAFIFQVTGKQDHHVQAHRFNQALPYWKDMSKVEIEHHTNDLR